MFEKYVDMIEANGGQITPEIIKEILEVHAPVKSQLLAKYERYKQTQAGVPILTREFKTNKAANKINNKLANDWFGEIVDTKVGYMFGLPVIYQVYREVENYQNVVDAIERFRVVNNLDDQNAEVGKFAAMGGYDAQLCYIDKEGQERVKRIDPWEAVIMSRTEITEPDFGLRYYTKWDDTLRVEFYDSANRTVYEGKSEGDLQFVEQKPHLFDYCPLFGVPNNAELMGDADKVFTLIDAFDRTLSDESSEIEQFRLAYMIFIGYEPDEKQLEAMMQTGALWIPSAENGEDIRFLTKQLIVDAIEKHLDRLADNITRFAKHVNFTDEAFGGNLSGVAMRYKLFALEAKAKTMERKHEAAQHYMFKVIASAWAKKGLKFDYTMLDVKYTRNIPINIVDEAQAAVALLGVTSRRTALEQLSFVTDVDLEMERIEQEKMEMVDLDNVDDGGQDDGNEQNQKQEPETEPAVTA